jgi:pimeloyl-ACP methyl ester carboxylesterase
VFAGVPDYIHDAMVRAYVKSAAFKPVDDMTLDRIVRPWTVPGGKAAFYRQMAQADSSYTDAVQPLYAQIKRPVLILWGGEDVWLPVEQGERLQEMIPGASLHVIQDAGHLIIEERPGPLIEKMLPFLEGP